MINWKTTAGLSLTVILAALAHACQPDGIQDSRSTATGQAAKSGNQTQDSNSAGNNTGTTTGNNTTPTTPGNNTPAAPAANYTMTWDVSTDAGITAYKIFVVPPDQNPRFPGKTDVPIQIKNYPIAGLQKTGNKYSVVVTSAEVKTATGALTVTQPCFTIVAVNAVGNSQHSPVICP